MTVKHVEEIEYHQESALQGRCLVAGDVCAAMI